MSIFEGAKDVAILGGTYISVAEGSTVTIHQGGEPGSSRALKELSAAAAHRALHDSAARFNAPRCHRGTRTKYLNNFELWMLGGGGALYGKRLIWLNGAAGAGKSAIMQTIVERCACYSVILGSFFFSRADPSRNYLDALIPTLAYQLARAFPTTLEVLEPIISGDPLIFMASPYTQAHQLLVRPLLHLIETGIFENRTALLGVFVIDGLDECNDPEKQALIVQVISSILRDHEILIGFLIASRPEVAITCAFQKETRLVEFFESISLGNDTDAMSDIRRFIEDSFLDILESHPSRMLLKLPWPRAYSVHLLVQKSSGHFIFASTAMKFIASFGEHPGRALEVVEGIAPSRTGSPYGELDALYMHILTQARYSAQVIDILKHCYLTKFSRSIAALAYIHNISLDDVQLFLSDVQSLISLVPSSTGELIIRPIHASLQDFLTTKERSQELYIEWNTYHASLLGRYFQLLDNGPCPPTSLFAFRGDSTHYLIFALSRAIADSQDVDLCASLIKRHSCYNIWNFCVESCAYDSTSSSGIKELTADAIHGYISAIRTFSVASRDKSLFLHQFTLYTDMVMNNLTEIVHKKPQYRIIPAIMFSSSHAGLYWAYYFLRAWGRGIGVEASYQLLFNDAEKDVTDAELDLSFEGIMSSSFSKISWGDDLAFLMKLVLERLVNLSRPSHIPYITPHKRWLRKHKPLKQIAVGAPRLSSAIFANLFTSARPDSRFAKPPFHTAWKLSAVFIWIYWRGNKINQRKLKCVTLLKAVIFYLQKSNCTIEVVNLARRSLPFAAQCYPKLMTRARAEMDDHVRRWERGETSPRLNSRVLNRNGNVNYARSVHAEHPRARYHQAFRDFAVDLTQLSRMLAK